MAISSSPSATTAFGKPNVDANGNVTFSGVGSGIDTQSIINGIMTARQAPVDRLQTQVKTNTDKITALQSLRDKVSALQSTLTTLRGAVSFDNSNDAFSATQASLSTSRNDGLGPSAAANLLNVSVSNATAVGTHTIEILRTAQAQKIATGAFNSVTADLGTARGLAAGSVSGSFNINGRAITILSTDTIQDVRDRINNADTGSNASGVSASIVSVSPTESYLVLTADKTGVPITINAETNGVLAALGISADGGTTYSNELQKAQVARFKADGLLDPSHYESNTVPSKTIALSTLESKATFPGSFQINGAGTATINYTSTTTLQDLADSINGAVGTTGVSASIVDDNQGSHLVLTRAGNSAFTLTDSSGLLADLGVNNQKIIERSSNTVGDLFAGATLNLLGSEEGTKITIGITQDLSAVKTQISNFVTAYNDLKTLINQNTLTDPTTGQKSSSAGVLFGDNTVRTINDQLAQLVSGGVAGINPQFSTLAQVGVSLVNNTTSTDPLQASTLQLDTTKLDTALTNNPDAVRQLLALNFSSSDPRFTMLGFTSATTNGASTYTLNVGNVGAAQKSSKAVTDANATLNDAINGAGATTSGSFQLNGSTINYDVTSDSVTTLANAINAAHITGISANVVSGKLRIVSTTNPIAISGDTGDLITSLAMTTDRFLVGRANIGGAADGTDNGTVTINGQTLTVTKNSQAQGLQLLFTGNADLSGVTLSYTAGLGAQLYAALDGYLTPTTGTIDAEIQQLQDQNTTTNSRITDMQARLAQQRQDLTNRYLAAEQALTTMNMTLQSVNQIAASLQPQNNN